jgi:hypothetical protein
LKLNTLSLFEGDINSKRAHLFVVSNEWYDLEIELTDTLDMTIIPIMLSRFNHVTFKLLTRMNKDILNMLCKCFPDKSGSFRKAFMLGKDVLSIL